MHLFPEILVQLISSVVLCISAGAWRCKNRLEAFATLCVAGGGLRDRSWELAQGGVGGAVEEHEGTKSCWHVSVSVDYLEDDGRINDTKKAQRLAALPVLVWSWQETHTLNTQWMSYMRFHWLYMPNVYLLQWRYLSVLVAYGPTNRRCGSD